ncbi:MAG: hypothetical protein AAF696_05385, partial [Bacteroidota bacterium]
KRISCLVQKHKFTKAQIREIEAGFRELYKNNYSEEKLKVFWTIFPEGSAYAERKPSNGTIILIEVDEEVRREKREELMGLYSQFLFKNYNISLLDTIITVANTSWVESFLAAQQKRIHPRYRAWIGFKTMFTALTSKWTHGFLRLRVKY